MGFLLHFFRTGPHAGPVLFLVGLMVGCSTTTNRSHVRDAILGVRIGLELEEAREKLSRLAERPSAHGTEESEPEAGKKEAWTLKGTEFRSVALQADRAGKVIWVTGFVRPGREIPFAQLGDLTTAVRATESEAIWNVPTARGGYRLVAKGRDGRAGVVYLLSLANAPQ